MKKITDHQFKTLKDRYYSIGRTLPLAFYGQHHSVMNLLSEIDNFRKLIIAIAQAEDSNGQ